MEMLTRASVSFNGKISWDVHHHHHTSPPSHITRVGDFSPIRITTGRPSQPVILNIRTQGFEYLHSHVIFSSLFLLMKSKLDKTLYFCGCSPDGVAMYLISRQNTEEAEANIIMWALWLYWLEVVTPHSHDGYRQTDISGIGYCQPVTDLIIATPSPHASIGQATFLSQSWTELVNVEIFVKISIRMHRWTQWTFSWVCRS